MKKNKIIINSFLTIVPVIALPTVFVSCSNKEESKKEEDKNNPPVMENGSNNNNNNNNNNNQPPVVEKNDKPNKDDKNDGNQQPPVDNNNNNPEQDKPKPNNNSKPKEENENDRIIYEKNIKPRTIEGDILKLFPSFIANYIANPKSLDDNYIKRNFSIHNAGLIGFWFELDKEFVQNENEYNLKFWTVTPDDEKGEIQIEVDFKNRRHSTTHSQKRYTFSGFKKLDENAKKNLNFNIVDKHLMDKDGNDTIAYFSDVKKAYLDKKIDEEIINGINAGKKETIENRIKKYVLMYFEDQEVYKLNGGLNIKEYFDDHKDLENTYMNIPFVMLLEYKTFFEITSLKIISKNNQEFIKIKYKVKYAPTRATNFLNKNNQDSWKTTEVFENETEIFVPKTWSNK